MPYSQQFKKLSFVFSVIVSLVGFFVLIGWAADVTILKSITPDGISMKANAALCFLLAGITLILLNLEKKNAITNKIAALFTIIIFLVGTVTIVEYIFDFNTGIDELFFKDSENSLTELPSGRQSLFSAAYFLLFGLGYFPGIHKRIRYSIFQLLHIISGVFVLASIMSYLFGHYIIAGISFNFILVIHSTISFGFLILAVLFSQPETGYMKLVSSNSIGGKIIRNTLPVFLLIFMIIGWLGLRGNQMGFYNTEFGVSIFVLLMIIIFGSLLISHAISLARYENVLKQSEEKLLAANKNLEAAEIMAKIGSWEYNMDGSKGIWSKQIFRLLGIPIADRALSFKDFLQFMHPEEREQGQKIFDQRVDGVEITNKTFRTNPQRGEIKYLNLDWHVIRDEDGQPVKYFGTLQSVTERVKAKEALVHREELFSKAFHSKVFGLAIVNQERRVVDINETLANLIEYKREDFIGKTAAEVGLGNPEYTQKKDELLLMLFQKGRIDNYDLKVETRKGKNLDLLLSVEPMSLNNKPHWLISLVDVTEQKKAQEELRKAVERFELIGKATNDAVWEWNLVTKEIWGNDSFYKLYGLQSGSEKLKNLEGYSRAHPDDVAKLKSTLAEAVKQKAQSMIIEFRFRMPDDTYRTFLDRAFINYDDQGKPIRLIGAMLDITERKKAERELAESESRLHTILQTVPDCIKVIDQKGELSYMNPAGLDMMEVDDIEQLKGDVGMRMINESYREPFYKLAIEVFKGKPGSMQYEITGMKGTRRLLETHEVPLKNSNGSITSLLGVTRDITIAKKAEKAIVESEEKYRTLVEQASDGILIVDMKGRFMSVNTSGCNLSGFTQEDLTNMSICDFIVGENLGEDPFHVKELIEGKTFNTEVLMKRKNDLPLYVECSAKLITEGRVLIFVRDISERKKAEEQVNIYNEELRLLAGHLQNIREEERSRIGREIHDELGQYLTALKITVSRLKMKKDEKEIIELQNQLDNCLKLVKKISFELRSSIIDDLGIVDALEWHAEEFEKVTEIKTAFQSNKKVLELPSDHAIGLFRIFQESLTNVARHSKAKNVTGTFIVNDDSLILTIKDDGKGFDLNLIDAKKSLGLLGMRERTLLMKGNYEINSAPGSGTEVKVTIPL